MLIAGGMLWTLDGEDEATTLHRRPLGTSPTESERITAAPCARLGSFVRAAGEAPELRFTRGCGTELELVAVATTDPTTPAPTVAASFTVGLEGTPPRPEVRPSLTHDATGFWYVETASDAGSHRLLHVDHPAG